MPFGLSYNEAANPRAAGLDYRSGDYRYLQVQPQPYITVKRQY